MQWDLGLQGLAVLGALSLGFGIFAQLMFWDRAAPWVGVVAAAAFAAVGLSISEIWFGWATAAELQPNIDGLSFDEVLIGYFVGVPVVVVARLLTARSRTHRPALR